MAPIASGARRALDVTWSIGYRRRGFCRAFANLMPDSRSLQLPVRAAAAHLALPVGFALHRASRLLVAAAFLLLAACATVVPPATTPTAPPGPPATLANNVLIRAIGLVGTPYHWGGNTPASGFDCSGLVDYVFRSEAGIALPRTSREIAAVRAPTVRRDDLKAGDLLFFGRGRHVNHVAIYVGHGRFVNAPDAGGTVRLDHLDGYYWRSHYLFAKRVLDPRVRAALAIE